MALLENITADDGRLQVNKKLDRLKKDIKKLYEPVIEDETNDFLHYMSEFDKKMQKMTDDVRKGHITQSEYDLQRAKLILSGDGTLKMRDKIAKAYQAADTKARNIIYDEAPEIYADGHNYGTYNFEKKTRTDTKYKLFTKKYVEDLLKSDPDLFYVPSEDARKQSESKDWTWNIDKLHSAIIGSLFAEYETWKMAERIRQVGASDLSAAIKSAVTKTTEAENKGRLDAYKRGEEETSYSVEKIWIATMDERTRASHEAVNGEVMPLDEEFSNGLDRKSVV